MSYYPSQKPPTPDSESLRLLARYTRKSLMRAFWVVAIALIGYELYIAQPASLLTSFAAVAITITALLPAYLWCSGRALGMPVFPFFGITFIWTYALPLVSNHPKVLEYSPNSQLFAGLTVSGFLLLGTLIWFPLVKNAPAKPSFYWALGDSRGNAFFLIAQATGVLFLLTSNAGWLTLPPGTFSAVRSVTLGLTALGAFVLSYRLGKEELPGKQRQWFIGLLISFMLVSSSGLILNGAAATFLVSTIAYVIGSKRVPILVIVVAFMGISLLHYGKYDMREKYWSGDFAKPLQPWEYPAYYAEWAGYGLTYFASPKDETTNTEEKTSFVERSSVIHMLLLAQSKSPDPQPYLYGKTYEILPQVVVPRILNTNRIRSQESTHMLSVYYGLQSPDATQTTSIAWGLIAESYANFGVLGCAGLAIALGLAYGWATRQSIQAPTLSLQSLFTVLILTFSVSSTEWTASTYLAALSQSSLLLLGIALCFMSTYPTYFFPVIQRE